MIAGTAMTAGSVSWTREGEDFVRFLTLGIGWFVMSWIAFAQGDRGTITGTVSDPAGAVVAAAPVEIRNVETGSLYRTASSATGNYTLAQLPAGQYELSVTVP